MPAGWAAAPFADVAAAERDGYAPKARQACATAAWTGPHTRARIETVLCDARISRVLTDRLGQVISLEALNDEITTAHRRTLALRDLGCNTRGCTRPPACCDAHHLLARKDGGSTDLGNVVHWKSTLTGSAAAWACRPACACDTQAAQPTSHQYTRRS